ncbi:hypothetical protein PENTCL1PPCAC_11324, partial [Pristionchus entomophagus]
SRSTMSSRNDSISLRSLLAGASAGLAVDLTLYPLDTIKTRAQSSQGFAAAGGLRNLYSGLGSVALGSAPGAAIFFCTYQTMNKLIGRHDAYSHAFAAGVGEILACTVRVPTELVKQRAQADSSRRISSIFREILRSDGFRGFFRGYRSTIAREIPFSLIEFPLWEALKKVAARTQGKSECSPLMGAACGSMAGGVAAALTTPLDVVKTRIMLSTGKEKRRVMETLNQVYREGGISRLFSGILPRSLWMSLGGFIFFGAYEVTSNLTQKII